MHVTYEWQDEHKRWVGTILEWLAMTYFKAFALRETEATNLI